VLELYASLVAPTVWKHTDGPLEMAEYAQIKSVKTQHFYCR